MSRPELLLVDLGSAFWMCWHSSATDELSAARDRTLNVIRRLVAGRDRKLVAICCDSPKSWRKAKHPSYKANRPEKDHAAISELDIVKKRLAADGLLLWECPGFEADDIVATACKFADQSGLDVLIASADKDLLSLVSHARSVRVISTKTGKLMLEEDVQAKLGVLPHLVRDWLALVGDRSDGVAGVPGVGPVRAAAMLNQFGGIEATLTAAASGEPWPILTPAVRQALNESGATIAMAIDLVTLSTDAPIDFSQLNEEREVKPLVEQDYMDNGDPEDDGRNEPANEQAAQGLSGEIPPGNLAAQVGMQNQAAQMMGGQSVGHGYSGPGSPQAMVRAAPAQLVAASFEHGLEPMSINGAYRLAEGMFNSRLYSRYPNAEAIWAVMIRGREMGLGALTALDVFHVVEGRPTMHASLVIGLVLKSGLAEFFDLKESSRKTATWITKRKGSSRETELTWDIEDACAAGLVERHNGDFRGVSRSGKPSNWDKYRRTMLRWRCGTELARAVYPDVTAGIYTPDELTDGGGPEETEE